MKNRLFTTILVFLLLFSILNIIFYLLLVKKRSIQRPMVTISGEVSFDDYKEGSILVIISDEKTHLKKLRQTDIFSFQDKTIVVLNEPGPFTLKVPADIGRVYIEAVNLDITPPTETIYSDVIYTAYSKNPIEVNADDIEGIVVEFPRIIVPKAKDYQGATVSISGNVQFSNYRDGLILVMAKNAPISSNNFLGHSIAAVELDKPGYFTLTVPENLGDIYLYAVNLSKQKSFLPPFGESLKNPIKVGADDISNVDIVFKSWQILAAPFIKQVSRPTIKLTGNVTFKDYKDGPIVITARSKKNLYENSLPDLAMTHIPAPGPYILDVPKEIGEAYIEAVNYNPPLDLTSAPLPDSPYGAYSNNPILIESTNLTDIDIHINTTFEFKSAK